MSNLAARSSRRTSKNRPQAAPRTRRRSFFETLENRSLLATLYWQGDVSNAWSNVNNWTTNPAVDTPPAVAPVTGDTLNFDTTVVNFNTGSAQGYTPNNDIAGLSNLTINLNDAGGSDFTLSGLVAGLSAAGISSNVSVGTGATISMPLTVAGSAFTTVNAPLTVSGAIGGTGLTKFGSGTLILSNANTYTGGSAINLGTLRIDNATATGTGMTVVNGATVAINNVTHTGAVTLNDFGLLRGLGTAATQGGVVTIANGATVALGTATSTDVLTITSALANAGGSTVTPTIQILGSGMVSVQGNSTAFRGNWNVQSGTMRVTSSGSFGNPTAAAPLSGSTLTLGGGNLMVRSDADITFNAGGATAIPVIVTADATITKQRAGAASTTAADPIFGTLSIGSQTLTLTNDASHTGGDIDFRFNGLATITGNPTFAMTRLATTTGTRVLLRFVGGISDGGSARNITFNNTGTVTGETVVVTGLPRTLLAATEINIAGNQLLRYINEGATAADNSTFRFTNTVANGAVYEVRNNGSATFNNNIIVDTEADLRVSRIAAGAGVTHTLGSVTINGDRTFRVSNANLNANEAYGVNFSTLPLNGNGTVVVNNNGTGIGTATFSGAVSEIGGPRNLTKSGAGTLNLNATSTYTGSTTVNQGTVNAGADNIFANNTLTMGSGANVASINFGTFDQTLTGLTVISNSANNNTIALDGTLTVNGGANNSIVVGVDPTSATANSVTRLFVSGTGDLNVTNTSGNLLIGVPTNPTSDNSASNGTLDLTGLTGSFTYTATTGQVRIGTDNGTGSTVTGNPGNFLNLTNTSNTITAALINIGDNIHNLTSTLQLGTGTNNINTATINVGGISGVGRRGIGVIGYNAPGGAGVTTIRNQAGTGSAVLNIGVNSANTGAVLPNIVDFSGHNVDAMFTTVNVGVNAGASTTNGPANYTNTLNFDTGTLAISGALNIGHKTSTSANATQQLSSVNIGGGTVTAGSVVMANHTSSAGTVEGRLTITGGTMTVAGNVTVAAASNAAGTSTGTLNLDGGVLQVNGNVQLGATTGNESGTVNFNGGTLRAGSNNATWLQGLTAANVEAGGAIIDSNGFNVTINQQLLDAGGGLTKEGVGTLTITAANQYTGDTNVNGGTLALQGGAAILDTAGPVNVGLGGTLQLNSSETVSSYNGAGDLVGTNDSTLTLGANTLTTTGNAAIANVTTAVGGGIISGGSITDTDDDNNVTGPNVYLQAANGIGTAANAIETAVGSIQLNNTTTGDINILNSNAGALLTVADLRTLGFGSSNPAGATTIINSSPLTVAAPVISAGPVLIEARDNGSVVNADFNTSDGGFTVVNGGPVEDPWTYNAATGKWLTNGTQNQGVPSFSELNSAASTVTVSGNVTLSFRHRYSFEFDGTRWDGGQVRISVNGGAFTTVPAGAFSANGYIGVITGNNILNGQQAFNGDSPGYNAGSFITSVANLGAFNAGDTIRVQFVGAWDEFAEGTNPNWEIDSVSVFTPSAVAGDDLTINATVESTGSSVTLNAGDNLAVNAAVTSATVTAMNVDSGNSDAGVGGNLTIAAAVTTPPVGLGGGAFLAGNTDNDTFTFNPQTTTEFRLFGDDPVGTPTGDTLVMNVSGTTNPTLNVPGTIAPYSGLGSGAWSFTSAHRPVLFGSIEVSTITGNHHVIYDNSVSPVANLVVMRDSALPTANVQLRDGSTIGNIIYQGTMSQILSLTINGSAGDDTVTVDDVNTLPDFGGTVPGVTDNLNLAGTAELLFNGLGGNDTLAYNLNGTTASQSYAIGNGTGAAGFEGEVQSIAAGITLDAYFQNVELARRTGVGASQQGLTIIGDASDNNFSIAGNGGATRTTITGYTPFEFSGNNYNAVTINALGGADTIDLVNFGTAQSNNPAINLNGGTEDDTIRVRSTIGAVGNTGLVSLNGGLGSDTFLLYDGGNTVDNITGQVDVDGADGNVGGATDTLIIVDSGDLTADTNVVIAAVSPGLSDDYFVDGINGVVSSDVVLRNIDVLDYTSTSGDDTIDGRFVNTVNGHDLTTVSLSGWLGADQFRLFTSDQIGGTGPNNTPSGVASGVAAINLYGDAPGNPNPGDGNDTFGDKPAGVSGTGATNVGLEVSSDTRMIRPSVTTAITIDGGAPTGLAAPLGDVAGDVLNVNISDLPNTTPVIVSTFGPGTVVAPGISPLVWSEIEDINLVDQNKLTNVQMGDLFARTTPNPDFVQITRDPTLTNPNRVRLRITASIGNYSASNKTIIYGGGMNDTITQANLTIPAEFYGEDGDDYLSGAMNNDWLVGGPGHDRINGSGGDNVIWGDNSPTNPGDLTPQDSADGGNDQLSALGGNDVFYGGGGNDLVSGGGGDDYAYGGQGDDILDGNDGDDRLYGGAGNDVISGHAGNDLLSGGDGDDRLYGGDGNDVIFGGFGVDQIDGGAGNDLLVTGRLANENSSWTSVANTTTFSPATYTLGGDNDAALLILLNQWAATSDPLLGPSLAITHDGLNDEVYGGTGDDDFCWEAADVVENFPGTTPRDYNAVGMGNDERFGPT